MQLLSHLGPWTNSRSSFPSWIPLNSSSAPERTLFVNPAKLSPEVYAYLAELKIIIQPYDSVWPFLDAVGKSLSPKKDEKETRKRVVVTGQGFSWKTQLQVGKVRAKDMAKVDAKGLITS